MPSRSRDSAERPLAIAQICETLKVQSEELRDTATQCLERTTVLLQEMRDLLQDMRDQRARLSGNKR
jgi:hypothetical protein